MKAQLWLWGFFTVLWIVLLVPSLIWWADSLLWVIVMSWWANVSASAAAFLTIHGELEQRKNRP